MEHQVQLDRPESDSGQPDFTRPELDFSLLALIMACSKEVVLLDWKDEESLGGLFKNEYSFLKSLRALHSAQWIRSYYGPDKKIFAMPTSKAVKMFENYSQVEIIASIRNFEESDICASLWPEFIADIQSK